jgi:hypothetical protein
MAYSIGRSVGDKGYLGLRDVSDNGTAMAKDVWECAPATDTWTRKPDLDGEGRTMAVGFALGSDIYYGLGINAENQGLSDTWRWKP